MDYTKYIGNLPVPPCAPKVNGEYLEFIVPGYRTNSVDNRNNWSSNVTEIDGDGFDGAIYRKRKNTTRDIKINFNITTNDRYSFNLSWDKLRWLLLQESSKFIFHDDPEYYMIGNVTSIDASDIDASGSGAISSNGSYTIHLSNPYRYSIREHEILLGEPEEDTFVRYEGFYLSKPRFEIVGTGDTYAVTLVDSGENVIELGLPLSKFTMGNSPSQKDLENAWKFKKDDSVVVNIETYSITINKIDSPEVGQIDNDWEKFGLTHGINAIRYFSYGAIPTIRMLYREVR